MKKLTNVLFALLILIFAGSCSSYQLVTLKSNIRNSEPDENVFENDTIKVTYSFKGENCPVAITVYNKLSKPVYVDWSKSAAIVDGNKLSYWKNKATLSASSEGDGYHVTHNYSVTSSEINGTISKDDRISFIPPQSYISLVPLNLRYTPFDVSNFQNSSKISLRSKFSTSKGTLYSFDDNSAPFKFRSFLTYSINPDISNPVYVDNTFWVSDIIQTTAVPEELVAKPSNRFYMSRSTGNGGIGALVVVGLVVLVLAAK